MKEDRLKCFSKYIKDLYVRRISYDQIGKYIKYVNDFLERSDIISKKGYNLYRKENAAIFLDHLASNAICDYLSFCGMGFGRKNKKKYEETKTLEKLSIISERNMNLLNGFMNWMYENTDYSENTYRVYHDSIKSFYEYSNEFVYEEIKKYLKTLEVKGRSPSTIRIRMTVLEKFGDWLKKPVKLKRPKFQRKLQTDNIPTEEEYKRLLCYLSSLKNKDYYFHVKILASTGARISEFLQFRWEDVLKGEIVLRGKGNKYRRFFFSRQLQKEVASYIKDTGKSGIVSMGRFGPITARGFSSNLKAWGKKAGIDERKMHAHAFRHFFAKRYLKKSKDVIQLAEILGHGSIDTTRIYLQKSHEEQRQDFNRNVDW